VGLGLIYGLPTKKYSACLITNEAGIKDVVDFIQNYIKPKRVAFLSYDGADMHALTDGVEGVKGYRERLKDAGINIVYEQYFPMDTSDLSPYLTKIKYLNPDLLFSYPNNPGQAIMINKQIKELGGWGSITYVCGTEVGTEPGAVKISSAIGTYTYSRWLAGSDEPGMKTFEDAYKQKYGKLPNYNQAYAYNDFWTAIKAIEMAGTDNRDEVAQALRSGNLEWDSAWGPLRIDSTGNGWYHSQICQIQEGGKLVKVFTTGQ
jgi:ABC-type branched-subunit amino acid transport system substrate-binding protein